MKLGMVREKPRRWSRTSSSTDFFSCSALCRSTCSTTSTGVSLIVCRTVSCTVSVKDFNALSIAAAYSVWACSTSCAVVLSAVSVPAPSGRYGPAVHSRPGFFEKPGQSPGLPVFPGGSVRPFSLHSPLRRLKCAINNLFSCRFVKHMRVFALFICKVP